MKFKLTNTILSLFIWSTVLAIGCLYNQELCAQGPIEDIVYFIDGSISMGTIVHVNRIKITVRLPDGTIIERPIKYLYRFSSRRHFREIYEQSVEYEDKKFMKPHGDW